MPEMRVGATVVGAALAVAVLGGCASEPAKPAPAGQPSVVMPGAPGDEPKVASSADLEQLGRSPRASDDEVSYARMMITHHEQALEMTALAPGRVEHSQVRALAERIQGAQGPEIEAMRAWLNVHSSHGSGHHGEHSGHEMMPGMATPEQLAQLESSRGAEFDRHFLRLMTAHHEGAVTMATDLLERGLNEQLHEMAKDVLVTQHDEIATMRRLLAEVGG